MPKNSSKKCQTLNLCNNTRKCSISKGCISRRSEELDLSGIFMICCYDTSKSVKLTLSSNCFEETHPYNSWRLQELQMWVMWKKLSALHHLKDQIKTVHDGRKDHKCDICNKNFALERKLKEHFKNHGWRNYTNWKM